MKIKSINIKNFKSIKDITIPIQCYGEGENSSNTTFLVGINECGKSAILESISLVNKGFSEVDYDNYCNLEVQDDSDESYIDLYADLELESGNLDFLKKRIIEGLNLPKNFVDSIIVNKLQKNTYCNKKTWNEIYNVEINDDLPFYQYIINKTQKIVEAKTQIVETIEILSNFNVIREKITPENAETFLKDKQELLTKAKLEQKIGTLMKSVLNRNMPKIQIWKPSTQYLINETINLEEFKEDPNISIPLKNIFSIYGKNTNEEIKTTVERALSSQARCNELTEKISDAVTKYINNIWKEHKIKIKISINSTDCDVNVEDKDKKYALYSMSQRSDGFKQFVSLILSLSAQNKCNELKNNIVLIDEPEVHLHPSGIRYMRDEILKIGKNNHVIVATHSNYMVDTAVPERHWIVSKEKGETNIVQMNEDFNIADDKVLFAAFGLNLIKELIPKNIIVVEGIDDKNIIAHSIRLLKETFFYSIKDAGGASKSPGYARLLSDENLKPIILFDADKDGKENKQKILREQKDYYSNNNVFTLKNILDNLPDNSTIEDLLPIDFVKSFFDSKMSCAFTLSKDEAIIIQIKRQNKDLQGNNQKLDSLKVKLSKKFCEDFKTKEELKSKAQRLVDFVNRFCEKVEAFNAS